MLTGVLAYEPRQWIARESERSGLGCKIVEFDSEKALNEALLRGDIRVALRLLSGLPVSPQDSVVIAALSERLYPAGGLLFLEKNGSGARVLGAESEAGVWVSDPNVAAQLLEIAPKLRLLTAPRPSTFEQLAAELHAGRCDAAFIAQWEWELGKSHAEGLGIIALHPLEVVPPPGQGVLAWQTHRDDLGARERLRTIHRRDTAALTNVERSIARALGSGVCAYCERDGQGFYHAFAAANTRTSLKRARASQSTYAGLAERLIASLAA